MKKILVILVLVCLLFLRGEALRANSKLREFERESLTTSGQELSHILLSNQWIMEFFEEDDDQYVTSESVKVCNYTKCKSEEISL